MVLSISAVLAVDNTTRLRVVDELADVGIKLAETPFGADVRAALANIEVPKHELQDTVNRLNFFTVTGSPAASPDTGTRPVSKVTPHELRLLGWLADGHTTERIGNHLGIPVATVKSQLQVMYRRLGARNRAHAVLVGFRLGILGGAR